jgi:hypothetical protein
MPYFISKAHAIHFQNVLFLFEKLLEVFKKFLLSLADLTLWYLNLKHNKDESRFLNFIRPHFDIIYLDQI